MQIAWVAPRYPVPITVIRGEPTRGVMGSLFWGITGFSWGMRVVRSLGGKRLNRGGALLQPEQVVLERPSPAAEAWLSHVTALSRTGVSEYPKPGPLTVATFPRKTFRVPQPSRIS